MRALWAAAYWRWHLVGRTQPPNCPCSATTSNSPMHTTIYAVNRNAMHCTQRNVHNAMPNAIHTSHNAMHTMTYAVNRHAVNCTTVLYTQKHSSSNICTEQEFTTVSQTTRRWSITNPIFWENLYVLQCNAMQRNVVEYDAMHYGEVEKNSRKWSTLGAYLSAVFCRKYA